MSSEPRPTDDRLDALAAQAAPRVLAEALELAGNRARDELADLLTERIVQRALHDPAEQPQEEPAARNREPVAAPGDTGFYAFAIIPARPVDLAGIDGIDGRAPLRIVQQGALGLVVSEVRLDLLEEVSEDDLSETGLLATLARRHDEVVRAVFEHGPVLPLRFGTVVADEDAARRLLAERSTGATQRLAHLDTHREWGVRLRREPTEEQHPETGTGSRSRREMSGTSYLSSRRQALQEADRAERQSTAVSEQVEEALGEQAVDVVHRGGAPGAELLADVAYLVPTTHEDGFLEAVERLRRSVGEEGLVLETTGPWPPYSFATLEPDDSTSRSNPGVAGSA